MELEQVCLILISEERKEVEETAVEHPVKEGMERLAVFPCLLVEAIEL